MNFAAALNGFFATGLSALHGYLLNLRSRTFLPISPFSSRFIVRSRKRSAYTIDTYIRHVSRRGRINKSFENLSREILAPDCFLTWLVVEIVLWWTMRTKCLPFSFFLSTVIFACSWIINYLKVNVQREIFLSITWKLCSDLFCTRKSKITLWTRFFFARINWKWSRSRLIPRVSIRIR